MVPVENPGEPLPVEAPTWAPDCAVTTSCAHTASTLQHHFLASVVVECGCMSVATVGPNKDPEVEAPVQSPPWHWRAGGKAVGSGGGGGRRPDIHSENFMRA